MYNLTSKWDQQMCKSTQMYKPRLVFCIIHNITSLLVN